MNKIILSILLLASGMSHASNDVPTEAEIKMNYAITCGTFNEIEATLNKSLSKNEKLQALEMRAITLDILENGQLALDRQGKYSGMACFGIVAAKSLILKNGCANLQTNQKQKVSNAKNSGLALCESLVESGDAMPAF